MEDCVQDVEDDKKLVKRKDHNVDVDGYVPIKKRKTSKHTCFHCGNNSASDSYFTLPNGTTRLDCRAKWLRFLELEGHDVPSSARICSKHFRECDIFNSSQRRKKIRRDAIPSVKIAKRKARTRKDGTYKCFECGNTEGQACYFTFPKDPVIFKKWIEFCDCAEEYILPSTRLCSKHFESYFITGSQDFKKKRSLREDAVPTIKVLSDGNTLNFSKQLLPPPCTPQLHPESRDSNIRPVFCVSVASSQNLDRFHSEVSPVNADNDGGSNSAEHETSLPYSPTPQLHSMLSVSLDEDNDGCSNLTDHETQLPCTTTFQRHTVHSDSDYTLDPLLHTSTSETDISNITLIPKYFNQIKAYHFATPLRARLCLDSARNIIKNKNRQIKSLRQKLRKSLKKIETLTSTVKSLKKQNKILEDEQWKC